jgi:hypothetical protein
VHYSAIYSSLSISCSTALSSNRAFSSSEFIAPRHDETEKEASHALLQPAVYRNYMLDREVTRPLFGLGVKKTVSLINKLLDFDRGPVRIVLCGTHALTDRACQDTYLPPYETWVSSAFNLEETAAGLELYALLQASPGQQILIWGVIAHSGRASYFIDTAAVHMHCIPNG